MSHQSEIETLRSERDALAVEHMATIRAINEIIQEAHESAAAVSELEVEAISRTLANIVERREKLIQKMSRLAATIA